MRGRSRFAQRVGTEGLSACLSGMLEALVCEDARREQENELDGRTKRSPPVELAARSVKRRFDIPDRRLIFALHRGRDFCHQTITVIKYASISGDHALQFHVMPPGPRPRLLY